MALKLNGTNSVAAPAYAGADADTGLQCGTDEVNLVTGGTARLKIDSSGRVGIGTTSPNSELEIKNASTSAGFTITTGNTTEDGYINFSDGSTAGQILYKHSDNYMRFYVNASERMRIDSSGRLLIGATSSYANSGADDLQIGSNSSSTETGITLGSTSGSGIRFADSGSTNAGIIEYNHGSDFMRFYTNASERMRVDSSGRLLINTTTSASELIIGVGGGLKLSRNTSGSPTNGQSLMSVGFHGVNDTNSNAAAEAKIEAFAAENHSGSTAASELKFYTKPSGTGPGSSPTERMRIRASGELEVNEGVLWQYNTGSTDSRSWHVRNDIHAYGDLAFRRSTTQTGSTYETKVLFKDTGGICFNGDTAAANALDDYEEGSFTPTLTGASGSPTHGTQKGDYTKIGRLVHCRIHMSISAKSTLSGALRISGLPFTVSNIDTSTSLDFSGVLNYFNNTSSTAYFISANPVGNSTTAALYFRGSTNLTDVLEAGDLDNDFDFRAHLIYYV